MGAARFVGFCFVIFAAFGAGYYYSGFTGQENFAAYVAAQPVPEARAAEKAPDGNPEFCAILTMPRSYLPFLERFKHNQLARDIKITPALIETKDGRITVIPKTDQPTATADGPPAAAGAGSDVSDAAIEEQQTTSTSIFGALAVYFLAGAKPAETSD